MDIGNNNDVLDGVRTASVDNFQVDTRITTAWVTECGTVSGYGATATTMADVHHRLGAVRGQTGCWLGKEREKEKKTRERMIRVY